MFSCYKGFQLYGFFIAFGIMIVLSIDLFLAYRKNIICDLQKIFIFTYLGAFLFGKLFFLIEFLLMYSGSMSALYSLENCISFMREGFCILGASFGGIIGMAYSMSNVSGESLCGVFPISILLIHGFGRIGCYYAHCCDGSVGTVSLYIIVVAYYILLFSIGLFLYIFGKIQCFISGVRYYATVVFFERFLFDIFRDDVIFLYFPISYYHIASIFYIIGVTIFISSKYGYTNNIK